MAEVGTSSQDSLPLSQETCMQLLKELDGSLGNIMHDAMNMPLTIGQEYNHQVYEMNSTQETSNVVAQRIVEDWNSVQISNQYIHLPENPPEQKRPVSSLPASENWPGDFSFCISFCPQVNTKGISWIFSKERNKLYVGKDIPCPVNFSTSASMPEDVYIRAMPLFSSSDHASERVTRCVNHSVDELTRGIFEAEHFIRSESNNACYENDPVTGRHSVIVPFENPSAGQEYSTYLYKFMCFGSCSGGPNRRAVMVVFTLEQRREVIGRQKVDLKVCACPSRDFKLDEKQSQAGVLKENKPVKRQVTDHVLLPKPVKKIKAKDDNYFTIKTHDKNCYAFLSRMKKLYNIHVAMNTTFPSLGRLVYTSSERSSEEEIEAS